MTVLTWDQVGERRYETGVDRGVLYVPDAGGEYAQGYTWNGLTTVTESPSGAEASPQYADNIKYLNLLSAEEFGATIEAFTFPDQFSQFDGVATPQPGVMVAQQSRGYFGLSYRTKVGNDVAGSDLGYKIHLIYGAQAAPSEKAYATINDSPEALAFSWEITTTPVEVPGYKPSALIVVDSSKTTAAKLSALQDLLWGTAGTDPRLPLPSEILSLFAGSVTVVKMTGANAPSHNSTTWVTTLPAVTGIQWKVNGVNKAPGALPALAAGETQYITASPLSGYTITGDNDWTYDRP